MRDRRQRRSSAEGEDSEEPTTRMLLSYQHPPSFGSFTSGFFLYLTRPSSLRISSSSSRYFCARPSLFITPSLPYTLSLSVSLSPYLPPLLCLFLSLSALLDSPLSVCLLYFVCFAFVQFLPASGVSSPFVHALPCLPDFSRVPSFASRSRFPSF
ncbi:putative transmembrane protein [Toxoplasma gondii GAB2-2007-GAL-DOM2]|uniref:Putative transmembrane protein n=2 Tax=Toxoplasma gondii TaxID=5811 RepID=A0A086LAT1_TOXGO|nr:putative transmembrane protein [Toxoplasma gondii GAB2-2007-GAL-DOM2]KFG53749.1 putative transmembrane protein [Toxoplasma gondii FOU]